MLRGRRARRLLHGGFRAANDDVCTSDVSFARSFGFSSNDSC